MNRKFVHRGEEGLKKLYTFFYISLNGFNHGDDLTRLYFEKLTLAAAWRMNGSKAKGDVGSPVRRLCQAERTVTPKGVCVLILRTCELVNYVEKKS